MNPRIKIRNHRQQENLNEGFHEDFIDEQGNEESEEDSSAVSEEDE